MKNKYTLNSKYFLKSNNKGKYLFNIYTGSQFQIKDFLYELLQKFNGNSTTEDIIKNFEQKDLYYKEILNLVRKGILDKLLERSKEVIP